VKNFKLVSYTKGITVVPGKIAGASFSMFMSAKTWASLSKKDQDAIDGASGEAIARSAKSWDDDDKVGLEQLLAAGAKQVTAPPAFMTELQDKLKFIEDNWIKEAEKAGVDGKAALAFFRAEAKALAAK
jgi:TRAP-type C4-dicarboxylate transport system substrate-binding protein